MLRVIFIFAGVTLIEAFDWILYVFGAFLLFTALKIARDSGTEVHPEHSLAAAARTGSGSAVNSSWQWAEQNH